MQVAVVCKVEAFVSGNLCWLLGACVRNNPAESALSLPNLYHFELLRIFLRKAATLENGNTFSDSPVNGGEKLSV